MKAKNAVEEEGRKKKDAQREAEEKAAVTAQEEQGKQRENTEKRELEKKKEAAEMSSKSVIIRPDNFSPKKNTILMPHTRIHPADARTYMFWIRPSGLQDGWANIFAKGANNGQRDPSIYFYPKSTRMHIRSGTDGNANDGEDPEAKYALPMFKWSHVAFAHSKAGFVVWLNGQKIVEKKLAGGPLTNSGDLFGSDAFHLPALCTMSDLRYLPRVVTEKELSEAIKAKNYQEITSNTLILREENFRPERSALLARADQIKSAGSETWMVSRTITVRILCRYIQFDLYLQFWIKPEGITAQWSNIIHKGAENMQRNPAVWFYPKSTRYGGRAASDACVCITSYFPDSMAGCTFVQVIAAMETPVLTLKKHLQLKSGRMLPGLTKKARWWCITTDSRFLAQKCPVLLQTRET